MERLMARRKQVLNISHGLYGSFISRNNDVGGYWGIGQLSLLAKERSVNSVLIDVIKNTLTPFDEKFHGLLAYFYEKTFEIAKKTGIEPSKIQGVKIELYFNISPILKDVPISTWGKQYQLSVIIFDDLGRKYVVSGHGYCAPHDPAREIKRRE
jgi:hypothetical protein